MPDRRMHSSSVFGVIVNVKSHVSTLSRHRSSCFGSTYLSPWPWALRISDRVNPLSSFGRAWSIRPDCSSLHFSTGQALSKVASTKDAVIRESGRPQSNKSATPINLQEVRLRRSWIPKVCAELYRRGVTIAVEDG